jgi:hypothetical protein
MPSPPAGRHSYIACRYKWTSAGLPRVKRDPCSIRPELWKLFLLALDCDDFDRPRQIFEVALDIGIVKPRCIVPISFDISMLPMHTGCM